MSGKSATSSYSATEVAQDQLLRDVFEMTMKFTESSADRDVPVVDFKKPEELASLVDFEIKGESQNHDSIRDFCEKALQYSVKTAHPRFCNQQFGGLDKYGLAGELVVGAANVNLHTFEVAPFFVMTEKATIEKSMKMFGYTKGEGTFCPGGSYSSMLAVQLARYRKVPDTKEKGLFGGARMVMFVSEQAHYSAQKNAVLLGIGTDNCISIACDESGRMRISELEKEISKAKSEGAIPFMVIGTAGTTVLGSFDRFHEIADLCEKYGLWFHVDACWGGGALLSKKHRHLCDGVERSDSVMWNPHKMIMMPIQCSLLLTKHKGLMHKVNNISVPYLFQPKKPYDVEYDVGRNLVQCGRRVDSFKLWLAWKAHGDEGFEKHVDKAMDNAQYLTELIKKRDNYRLVIPDPVFTNVSFWFIPPSLRNKKEDDEFWEKLHLVAPVIKGRIQDKGTMLIGYQPLKTTVNFFRMTVMNGRVTHEDMDFALDEIEKYGQDL